LFPGREILSPSLHEIELWQASERERKEAKHKIGLRTCPQCPATRIRYPCPFAKPVDFDLTNKTPDPFSDQRPDYWLTWTECNITEDHFKPDPYALDNWLDMGHTVDDFFQLLDDK
jgi:hypothetical protein